MRYSNYGKNDSQPLSDGDAAWIGLDMREDDDVVQPGYLTIGENVRMWDKTLTQRDGISIAQDFNPPFEDKIIGCGVFNNPNADRVFLVATTNADYVWALQSGKDPVQINLEGGQGLTGTDDPPFSSVQFIQAFDRVLMLRKPNLNILVWDGDNTHTFDHMVLTPITGRFLVPQNAWDGEPFEDRILYYNSFHPNVPFRDRFIMSDVEDETSYDPSTESFRINAGRSDSMMRILPYHDQSVLCFFLRSIYQVANFTIDPALTQQVLVNPVKGTISNKSPCHTGNDVIFLSKPGGFYKLSEVNIQVNPFEPVPISQVIQPIIDRIVNWDNNTFWSCSQVLDDYAYFSLSLDNFFDTGCNAILVRSLTTDNWESLDTWMDPTMRINSLQVMDYQKQDQVLALDYFASKIYVLGLTGRDEINDVSYPIPYHVRTRGYNLGVPDTQKRYLEANISIETSNPGIEVMAVTDGYNESEDLVNQPITKDRTKFYIHGHKDFAPGDDPTEPYRQDYTVGDVDFDITDFSEFPLGPILILPPTTTDNTGPSQQSLESFPIPMRGRWVAIDIKNTNGTCSVLNVGVDGIGAGETLRVKA